MFIHLEGKKAKAIALKMCDFFWHVLAVFSPGPLLSYVWAFTQASYPLQVHLNL